MSLRNVFGRLTGQRAPSADPQIGELRRLLEAGDEARRNHQPDLALQSYQEGLTLAQNSGAPQVQEVFLGQIGALYTDQGRYDLAEKALNEALALAEQATEVFRRARALLNLGAYNLKRGDLQKAQGFLEEALELGRKSSDTITTGLALGNLADVYLKQNNPSYALRLLKEAAPQILQNSQQASYLLGRMGQAYLGVSELDQGRKFLAQAVRLAEQNGQSEQQLMWTSVLADHLYQEGQLVDALKLYQQADELAQVAASIPMEYDALRSLAHQASAYHRLGRNAEALALAHKVLERARVEGNATLEAMMLMTLGSVHQTLNHTDEAITALTGAVALYGAAAHNEAERIKALIALGSLYQDQGQAEKAMGIFDEALAAAGDEDRLGRAQTLRRIGLALQKQGNLQGALEKWTEAFNLFEGVGQYAQMARLLCDIGATRRALSGINAAMPDYERATVLLNHVQDTNTRGLVFSNVANLYTDLGEVETARSHYEQAIDLARQASNRHAESLRLGNFAWFHIVTGQPREGMRLLETALAISRELNDPLLIAVQTSNLAQAYHELKDYAKAEELCRQAITAAANFSESRWGAMFRSNLGRTLLARDRADEAIAELEAALPVSRDANDQEMVARTLARLGEAYLRQGRVDEADKAATESESLSRKWGYRKGQADALVVKAGVARARNDSDTNVRCLKEARRLYNIVHDPLAEELARVLGE